MTPTYRKPIGILLMVLGIMIYAGICARLIAPIAALPKLVQTLIYIILGIVWIAPLKPLLLWMETGRWRVPR